MLSMFLLLDGVGVWLALHLLLCVAFVVGCGKKRPAVKKPASKSAKQKSGKGQKSGKTSKSKSKSSKSQKSTSNSSKKSKHPRVEKIKENLKEAPVHAAEALHLRSKDAPKSAQTAQLDQAKSNVKEAKKLAADEIRSRSKSHSQESSRLKGRGNSTKTAKEQESHSKEALKRETSGFAVPANWNDGQKLSLEPQELRWKQSGGLQNVSLYNKSGSRQAVKVKCSDNLLYRVNPVYAFVEDGQTLKVDIVRENGSAKVDKIVLLTAKASPNDASPKDLFKANGQHQMIALPLIATASAL